MKTNPVAISLTLIFHLFVGGVLLFTQGCQSTSPEKPEKATPPQTITASELDAEQTPQRWDNKRLAEPTRPSWAVEPQEDTLSEDVWNPSELAEAPKLEGLIWDEPVHTERTPSKGNTDKTANEASLQGGHVYRVVAGDTLSKIARNKEVSLRALLDANGLNLRSIIRPGQELVIPEKTEVPVVENNQDTAVPLSGEGSLYTVKAGDSLSVIARRYGVSIAALKSVNGLTGDIIRIGQQLQIPGKSQRVPEKKESTEPSAASRVPAGTGTSLGDGVTHKVRSGDMLSTIARRYGTTVEQIKKDNHIQDERRIQIGQELVIRQPDSSGTARGGSHSESRVSSGSNSLRERRTSTPPAEASSEERQDVPSASERKELEEMFQRDSSEPSPRVDQQEQDALKSLLEEAPLNPIRE